MFRLALPSAAAAILAASCVLAPATSQAATTLAIRSAAASAVVPVANARNPYGNVDRRLDSGNDTGDSQVERLNSMQLDQNYRGPSYAPGGPPPGYAPPPPPPGYGPPPGGYGAPPPPPPGYAPGYPPRY